MPTGRPPKYSSDLADHVCDLIASGWSAERIEREQIVSAPTIAKWCLDDLEGFAGKFARARDLYAITQECRINDLGVEMVAEAKAGGPNANAIVSAYRAQIDNIKWELGKLMHRKYGDRVSQEISGPDGGVIQQRVELVFVDPPADTGQIED